MVRATTEHRERIIILHKSGFNNVSISRKLEDELVVIGPSSIGKIVKRYKECGEISARKRKAGVPTKITPKQYEGILDYFKYEENWSGSSKSMFYELREKLLLTITYSTFIRTKNSIDFQSGPLKIVPLIR